MQLRQVSWSQFNLIRPRGDFLLELVEAAEQGIGNRRGRGHHHPEPVPENPGVGAGAEHGGAKTKVGETVPMGFGDALDQSVAASA